MLRMRFMELDKVVTHRKNRKSRRGQFSRTAPAGGVGGFQIFEPLEGRQMFSAHIVGSSTVYSTIQSAVDAAVAGQTINVDAGTYDETVIITKSLNIRGAEAGVDARNKRSAESIVYATQTVFDIRANDVTIDGFTIEGDDADIGALQGAGVLMRPSIQGTHVLNNIIQNNVTGIYLSNDSDTDACVIQHNLIQNNFEANNNWQTKQENGSRGIYTDGTVSGGLLTNVLIDSNTIANFNFSGGDEDEGIIAFQALTAGKQFNITISNNTLTDESKALLATNVTNLSFIGNTVTNFRDGSSGPVRFEGNANTVNIQYNTIDGNAGPGVAADSSGVSGDSSGFVVNNNNIYNNDGIGLLTIANEYDGPVIAVNDWWGDASGSRRRRPGKRAGRLGQRRQWAWRCTKRFGRRNHHVFALGNRANRHHENPRARRSTESQDGGRIFLADQPDVDAADVHRAEPARPALDRRRELHHHRDGLAAHQLVQ